MSFFFNKIYIHSSILEKIPFGRRFRIVILSHSVGFATTAMFVAKCELWGTNRLGKILSREKAEAIVYEQYALCNTSVLFGQYVNNMLPVSNV